MSYYLLDFLALGAILSGILVIVSKNPVISVLFLISVFINVAGYLVLLGVGFIGISYLIVYVGAIAILFLFVVMMLNLQLAELNTVGKEYTQNLPLGLLLGSLFIFELVSLVPYKGFLEGANASTIQETELGLFHSISQYLFFLPTGTSSLDSINNSIHASFTIGEDASSSSTSVDTIFANFHQIQSIGQNLYTSGSLWLIVASCILLLAMVGPIVLSLAPAKTNGSQSLYHNLFTKTIFLVFFFFFLLLKIVMYNRTPD